MWIRVGGGKEGTADLGLKKSLQVIKAKRNGVGVTALRGYFLPGASVSIVSSPADAGDGGEPEEDDNRLDNVFFVGEAILRVFLTS